jgi:hypothetical protein
MELQLLCAFGQEDSRRRTKRAAKAMSDEFVNAFQSCQLAGDAFHHRDHVRMAFLYLSRHPTLEAIRQFSSDLARFAASKGKPERYHETITWALLLLIRERIARADGEEWEGFAARNPDLLDWQHNILHSYYRPETLASDLARRVFVLPDRMIQR